MVDEDRNLAFTNYKPDFLVTLLWPQLDYFKLMLDPDPYGVAIFGVDRIGYFTKTIDSLAIDHVLYFVRFRRRDLFSFLKTFDSAIWTGMYLSILSVSAALINTKKIRISRIFGSQLLLVSNAILTPACNYQDMRHLLRPVQKLLFVLWLSLAMLLQWFFGGDMFSKLAMDAKPIVIDSLWDLHHLEPNLVIKTVDVNMVDDVEDRKSPFNPSSPYFDDFTSRLELLDFREVANVTAIVEGAFGHDPHHPDQSRCIVGLKQYLLYINNFYRDGVYRKVMHVSNEGADAYPHMFTRMLTADEREAWAMDYVLVMLEIFAYKSICIINYFL